MHNIVYQLNVYKHYTNNVILIRINQAMLFIATPMIFLLLVVGYPLNPVLREYTIR